MRIKIAKQKFSTRYQMSRSNEPEAQMIFENEALASRLSRGERDLGRKRHDEKKVATSVLGAYQEICQTR